MSRIPANLLAELIANEGELRTGPINSTGVLRLALDLQEARAALSAAPNGTMLAALRTTEAEIVTLIPRLTGPYRANMDALLVVVRKAIKGGESA